MKTTKIEITVVARTESDFEVGFDVAIDKIKDGFIRGYDSNRDGSYNFTVKEYGEYEETEAVR